MSSVDQPNTPFRILPPYHGSSRSRFLGFLRRFGIPLAVLFALLYGLAFGLYGPFLLVLFPIPLGIMAMLSIWALPDMKRGPTAAVEGLFFLFFFSLLLWPNYLAIALPGLPWITMLRLWGAPMALLFLTCISVSPDYRAKLLGSIQATPAIWRLLVAFAGLQVLTIFVSDRVFVSAQKTFNNEVYWGCIYFVSAYIFLRKGRPTLWAAIYCLSLAPVCAIVFREHQQGQVPWANHIPPFLKIDDESVNRVLAGARRDGAEYRVQGVFTTPLGLAEYIALAMPFLIHFVASPIKIYWRVAAAVMVPISIYVVVLSDSRLGLVGCILSFLLYTLLWALFWWRKNRESMIGPAIVLSYPVLVVFTFIATLVIGRVREKLWGSGQYEASNEGRKEMYRVGIPMIFKHFWGYGAGRGAEKLGMTNQGGVLTIDTYYLLIGLEYGVLGFILYYGFLAVGIYYAGRKSLELSDRRSETMLFLPLAVAIANYFIIKSVFSNEDNHPLVFMMLGMISALCFRYNEDAKKAVAGVAAAPAALKARLTR